MTQPQKAPSMKLTVTDPVAFGAAVTWVARHLTSRPTIAVLASIRIHATSKGVRLAAFDYDVLGLVDPCPGVTVDEKGLAVVSGQLFAQLCTSLKPTRIELGDDGLHLTGPRSKARVPIMDARNLPDLPEPPVLTVEVQGDLLAEAVHLLAPLCADPNAWAPGAGINIATDNGLVLSASDRYRIGRHLVDAQGDLPGPMTAPAAPLLAAVKGWTNEEAYLGAVDGTIVLQQQERISSIRCIAEPFPNIDGTIATVGAEQFTLDAAELRDALKQVAAVAPAVHLEVDGSQVRVSAAALGGNQPQADWDTTLACESTMPTSLKFNASWLLSCVDSVASPTITFAFRAGARPTHINPGTAAVAMVMGIRKD